MPEIKYDRSHHAGGTPEARIANRLRTSGSPEADTVVQKGSGPTRTFHNISNAADHLKPPAGPTAGRVQRHPETEVSGGDSAKVGGGPRGADPISRDRR